MDLKESTSKAIVPLNTTDKPVKGKKRVHDEDTHIANLEKIIVRDYFPDLPTINAQLEYMDAVKRKDTQKIWQLQQQYSVKRTASVTPSVCTATPSTFETPNSRVAITPRERPNTGAPEHTDPLVEEQPTHNPEPPPEVKKKSVTDVGLDTYLSHNTSEDNASFEEIMKDSEKRHQMKHAWLYDKEDEHQNEHEQILALPSAEDQYNIKAPNKVQSWKYVAKNAVMYVPEGVELSATEKIENAGKKPEVVPTNTRFRCNPFNQEKQKESIYRAAAVKAMKLQGKIGPDGKEILPSESPKIGGYGFLATPSITPGVDASPLMTWGEIDGTPFRLDGSDTPLLNRTPGPAFRIPEVPLRDRCLHELVQKAHKAHRAKKEEALKQVRSTFASQSPKFSQSRTDRLQSLSPAAQFLANKKLMINAKTDKALRSSYTPSPGHRLPGDTTPVVIPSPSSNSGTPSSNCIPNTPPSITDNLLQLPKRPKAQEFF